MRTPLRGRRGLPAILLLALVWTAWCATARADTVRFRIQSEASAVTFKASSRLMNADGRFHHLAGEVLVDPKNLGTAKVTLSIEAASIDTGITLRDNHLRSEDFFDARRFPLIAFESVRAEAAGGRAIVVGRLTLHGVTREIAVPVDVAVTTGTLMASGELVVNRRDYGLSYDSFVNPIANDVRVAFTIRALAR
jgi:polyisoprenoid-binding protein YceI